MRSKKWRNDDKVSTVSLPYESSITLIDNEGNKNANRRPLAIPHALTVSDLIVYVFDENGVKKCFPGVNSETSRDHIEVVMKVPSHVPLFKTKKEIILDNALVFTHIHDYLWKAV